MALKGIKVIEFAGLAPAPFCGMILQDFGARVIRVDKLRGNTDLDALGNGKQSIAVNLKHSDGITIIRKLCEETDVLLEPFRQGVMESLGLGPNILLKDNPKLIYARLTGFGQSGVYSKKAGHDINYVAMSGLLSLFGRKGENPIFPVNLAADFGGGGLTCALGIILALFERSRSGKGQVVDCDMVSGTSYLGSWLYRSQKLPIWGNERGNNILDTGAHFYEVYKTKDGKYISVGALEPQFYTELLKGLGLTEEKVPHFMNFDEGKALFQSVFIEKTQEEWMEVFKDLDACVAPVLSLEEAPLHQHNVERKTFVRDNCNELVPAPSPHLSRTPGQSKAMRKYPQIGEHTKLVLKELNYSEADILNFEKEHVVGIHSKSNL